MSPSDELGTLVGKVRRAMVNRLNYEFIKAGFPITMQQWITLTKLEINGSMFQKELADMLELDKTSITRMIDGLEKRGWVKRKIDTNDRRHKIILITEKGMVIKEQIISIIHKVGKLSEHGLEIEEINTCKSVLQKIQKNVCFE